MTMRPALTFAAVAAIIGTSAACTFPGMKASPSRSPSGRASASGTSNPRPTPAVTSTAVAGVTPGHDTPAAALAGLIAGQVERDNGTACSFVLPSQQAACPSLLSLATTTVQGGPVTFGDTYTLGNQALVVPLGTLCLDTNCRTNSNRRLGLPANDAGFAGAYQTATATDILTTGCQKVQGTWYVDLGPLQSDTQPI